jgi:hypothetical protein
MIGALLGHADPATTHRYSHLMADPLRQVTERVGAVITAAGNGNAGGTIETLPSKGKRHGRR